MAATVSPQDTLHTLVEGDGEPTPVHRFLAGLPSRLRERESAQPLLVTTGYELALERALEEAGETVHFGPPYTRPSIRCAVRKAYSATARHVPRVMRSVRNATSSGAPSGPSRHCLAP